LVNVYDKAIIDVENPAGRRPERQDHAGRDSLVAESQQRAHRGRFPGAIDKALDVELEGYVIGTGYGRVRLPFSGVISGRDSCRRAGRT
jgi:hypothetical protein